MANPQKASGYAFSLNLVRSLGLWSSSANFPSSVNKPAYIMLNPTTGTVDWSEQLRKYLKHNSGSSDSELVAAQTRLELAVWRAVERRENSQSYGRIMRRATTKEGKGPAASQDWVVRNRKDRSQIQEAKKELEVVLEKAGNGVQAINSRTLLALAQYAVEDFQSSLQLLRASTSLGASTGTSDPATHDLDLQILSTVLQGLALEHVAAQSTSEETDGRSRQIVREAILAYRALPIQPPPPVPEARRYIEAGLGRLALLPTHVESSSTSAAALAGHKQYFSLTESFPTTSPPKRMMMYRSYLTTLLAHLSPSSHLRTVKEREASIDTSDVSSTFIAYEKLLYTHASLAAFPRAGEPTPNIYDYISLLYSYWELGHLQSRWVADSLYRALSKTYASQRIHRYLVIVLSTMSFVETDRRKGKQLADDAMRNLRLYVKLFEKSRETDQVAVQKEMKAFRRKTEGSEDAEEDESLGNDDDEENDTLEKDEDFCRTACMGTRLLLVESRQDNKQEQEDDRLDLIKEAHDLVEKAAKTLSNLHTRDGQHKDRITEQDDNSEPQSLPVPASHASQIRKEETGVIAETHLWHGVALAEWALAEANAETGRSKGKNALESLSSAVSSLPRDNLPSEVAASIEPMESFTASSIRARALYSLAYAQLEVRDVASATLTAKKAVEAISDKSSVRDRTTDLRIWHLFVLALSAKKEWSKAREIADLALSWEEQGQQDEGDMSRQSIAATIPDNLNTTQGQEPVMYPVTAGGPSHNHPPTGQSLVQTNGDSNSSSFVSVQSPTDNSPANGAAERMATRDFAESPDGDASRSRKASPSGLGSNPAEGSLVTHRTTSAWDDLETEIELWITRNQCIEAVEGPEMALQDLQQNVFVRFSRRRDELEIREHKFSAATNAATKGQAALSRTAQTSAYPYPSQEMRNSQSANRKLDHHRSNTVTGTGSPGRARSVIGSISLRHRSRTNRVRANGTPENLTIPNNNTRPGSIHSNASNATSGSGSNLIGSAASIHSNTVNTSPSPPQTQTKLPHPQAAKILSRLWLTSAASFRRWGKLDECRGAINEAEDVAGETDPEVWIQYALYLTTRSPPAVVGKDPDIPDVPEGDAERALLSYQKALAISMDHEAVIVGIGKLHLEQEKLALAEGFLDVATQTNAWDSPEAWYLLAKTYEATGRTTRARECLLYALELEGTRPIRELRSVLRRWV